MLKKISFKQIVVNNEQMFALSEYGEVFEWVHDEKTKKSFWLKLPSEYEDGAPSVTATISSKEDELELGQRNSTFWDAYEQEQKRKMQR